MERKFRSRKIFFFISMSQRPSEGLYTESGVLLLRLAEIFGDLPNIYEGPFQDLSNIYEEDFCETVFVEKLPHRCLTES